MFSSNTAAVEPGTRIPGTYWWATRVPQPSQELEQPRAWEPGSPYHWKESRTVKEPEPDWEPKRVYFDWWRGSVDSPCPLDRPKRLGRRGCPPLASRRGVPRGR